MTALGPEHFTAGSFHIEAQFTPAFILVSYELVAMLSGDWCVQPAWWYTELGKYIEEANAPCGLRFGSGAAV